MPARLLFSVFLVLPLIEIALFVVVGQAIGVGLTLLAVVLGAIFGSLIIRERGLRLLAEIRQTMGQGILPAQALADAMLVSLGGALLVVPGFFTDFIGLLLLLPPVRGLIYRFLGRRMKAMTPTGRPGWQDPSPGLRIIELDDEHFRPR